jgi:hypothetical protein
MLNDLLDILTKNENLKALKTGMTALTGDAKQAAQRQAVYAKETSLDALDEFRGQTYGQVTKGRPLIEHALGISEDTSEASRIASSTGLPGADSGDQDTMRHLSLSARLQRKHPVLAKTVQTGHEVTGLLGAQTWAETKRDLSVNAIGRKVGENVDTDQQGDEAAYALASGPMSNTSALRYVQERQRVWSK